MQNNRAHTTKILLGREYAVRQMSKATPVEERKSMPQWVPPCRNGKKVTGLMVNNSMTGGKVEFIPVQGSRVNWYGCGPTVYDDAHMGHARTYVTFDVIRRIMEEYFGYHVFMVMNITDIDDKIIQRSLDRGETFLTLARRVENSFWEDMRSLSVQTPHVITRVSEYVPENVAFIEKIVHRGYAYASDGSVYFDVKAFQAAKQHIYGRMEPWSVSDQSRVLEGEGTLGFVSEKRNPGDFALWKKAKDGEPSWPSSWGPGRPGWHIECSAMASTLLNFPLDIHSGGIDLRFPHHDNELAQSEAYFDQPQWVNYFLHSGHLNIQNRKMSKSLKNFVTIKEFLDKYSPRALRILCLIHRWDHVMNYSPGGESMAEAVEIDSKFSSFFANIKAFLRQSSLKSPQNFGDEETILNSKIDRRIAEVHAALCDNFNTPEVMLVLQNLVSEIYSYTNDHRGDEMRIPLVTRGANFVYRMLSILGLTASDKELYEYDSKIQGTAAIDPFVDCLARFRASTRASAQLMMASVKKLLVTDNGSSVAEAKNISEAVLSILLQCDKLRDEDLKELGIQLEDDSKSCGVLWKAVDKEDLRVEMARKEEEDAAKQIRKEAAQAAREKKDAEAAISPEVYFKTLRGDEFSTYDEEGIPLEDTKGESVSKGQREKMKKILTKHKQQYDAASSAAKSSEPPF